MTEYFNEYMCIGITIFVYLCLIISKTNFTKSMKRKYRIVKERNYYKKRGIK